MDQSDLNKALMTLGRIIPSRPSKPILSNVLCEPSKDSLKLTAFDESIAYTTTVSGAHSLTDALCIPGKFWESITAKLAGELALSVDESVLVIESKSGRYEISTHPADDFPSLPTPDEAQSLELSSDDLLAAIKATLPAVSSDESKQVLTGAHFKIGDDLEVAATDGHRLSMLNIPDADLDAIEATIPGDALRTLERIIETQQEPTVQVLIDRTMALFAVGNDIFSTRLLDGQYPNYRQLIPKNFERQFTFNRKAAIEALERIAVFAAQRNNIVKLSFGTDELQVSADAAEVGGGVERLPCDDADEFEAAFNLIYLLQGLKGCKGDEVTLQANTPTSPVVIEEKGRGFTYLIMPVQIRN